VQAILGTLLGMPENNIDGNPSISLGPLHPELISFLEESSPKDNLTTLQLVFSQFLSKEKESPYIVSHDVNLSPDIFSIHFAASRHTGMFSQHSLVDPMAKIDRLISLFALLRRYKNSEELQAALEKDNDVQDEHMLGESSSNTTKASTKIANVGAQLTHQDLCASLANAYTFFHFFLTNNANMENPFLLNAICCLYSTVQKDEHKKWFEHFCTNDDAYWLCHAFLSDAHNVISQATQIAMDPKSITSVLTKVNVDGSSLKAFHNTVAATISKWEGGRLAQSLGHFNAVPRTLPEEITSKKEKRDAKKEAKHLKTDHPSNDQRTGGQQSNGDTNRNQSSFGNFNGNHGSIPTKGFIKATPTDTSLPTQPSLPCECLPCPDFIIQGRSCPHGQNCRYNHLTSLTICSDKIPAYDNWIASIPVLYWVHPPQ